MKYYCIGIKGTGMSTLAQILFDLGNEVTGYDDYKEYKFTQKGLEDRNINIYYDNSYNIPKDSIVTYSVAFSLDHPELKRVRESGIKIKKYNEIMADIIKMFDTISVSGTHGKTTTTTMIRNIINSQEDCNYFIGAGDGKVDKNNRFYTVESDEFNKHFMIYNPRYSIITNIEKEHLECYTDLNDIIHSFEIFSNNTKELVVANGDNINVRKINFKTKHVFFGFNNNNDIIIKNLNLDKNGSYFEIYYDNRCIGSFNLPLFGKHLVYDACAAIIISLYIGIPFKNIKEVLSNFHNAARRFDITYLNENILIDDYAHHPTEIQATLESIRQKFPNKKVVGIFKPNTFSRTIDFKNDFINVFKDFDEIYLTPIESNREKQEDFPNVSSNIITNELSNARLLDENNLELFSSYRDCVFCVMSCASVSNILNNLKDIL